MTADEIIKLAKEMRDAQKSWFLYHNRSDLDLSRKLERQLDTAIDEYLDPQPTLFEPYPRQEP